MMDSSDSGFTTDQMTESSMSSMRSDRLEDDTSEEDEGSEYSLADSYDEEVAEVHEHENELKAKADKEKAQFSITAMINQQD